MSRKTIYSTRITVTMSEIASMRRKCHTTDDVARNLIYERKLNAYRNLITNCDSIKTNGSPIICLEYVGSYKGVKSSARKYDFNILSANLKDCFTLLASGWTEWYLDETELMCIQYFDNGEYKQYWFRQFKPNVTNSQIDVFCSNYFNGIARYDDVKKYTVSIGKYFK